MNIANNVDPDQTDSLKQSDQASMLKVAEVNKQTTFSGNIMAGHQQMAKHKMPIFMNVKKIQMYLNKFPYVRTRFGLLWQYVRS